MGNIKHDMEHMKDDIKKGAQKVGKTVMNTAENLKDDAQGFMANMETKMEDAKEKYEGKKFSKE